MKKLILFALVLCMAALLVACGSAPVAPQATQPVTEQVPAFSVDAVQPLIYAAGSVVGWGYAAEFDAARGSEVDRLFADALLYEFLNAELYDESIHPGNDYENFQCVLEAEDMFYLLRQYIGDYPALIVPAADVFLSRNEMGEYVYGRSDKGITDYEMKAEDTAFAGDGVFEVTAALYELEFDEDSPPPTLLGRYTLRFLKADDSAYGYTIIKCEPKPDSMTANTYEIRHEKDGAVYTATVDKNQVLRLFDAKSNQLQSLPLGSLVSIELEDVNLDGYTDIAVCTGGTVNETHDLYIWDTGSHSFIKVGYKGFEMLSWYEVYDGYIRNFIRENDSTNSTMEKLLWNGNNLVKDAEWGRKTGALHFLFNSLYDTEAAEDMVFVDFVDNEFLGYEYQIYIDANPRRMEYYGMSKDQNYYIFWLNEQVYHDGEFSHATTADFIAVDKNAKEIIRERADALHDDWNDDFPW
jgi:hypothetical protein